MLRAELEHLVERHGPAGSSKGHVAEQLNSRSKVSCGILPTAPPAALEACPRVAAAFPEKLRRQEEVPQIVGADERALIRSKHPADQAIERVRIRTSAHHGRIQLRHRERELPHCVVMAPLPERTLDMTL
jgi:hypothetical protein